MATASASGLTGNAPNLWEIPKPKQRTPLLLGAASNNDPSTIDNRLTALVDDAKAPKFSIHQNIICHHSPYFTAAFNGNFVEGRTQTMTLDVDAEAFGILVDWLYNQVIVSETGTPLLMVPLVRVWIMADEFLMPELQDEAVDKI